MTTAFHLHLYYPDVALELIERIGLLGRSDIAVFATHVGPIDRDVSAALDRLPGSVERIEVANGGWDIGPLFAILPRLRERGVSIVGKLHTKKGDSGYGAEWRGLAYDGLIAGEAQVARIERAFEEDPGLALVGPEVLYKSAAAHLFGNGESLPVLAAELVAPGYPPSDWGFFAGTFFWARLDLVEAVGRLAPEGLAAGTERDGEIGHALERLFGLAPALSGGRIGLSTPDALRIVEIPGEPDQRPIVRTLVERAERAVDTIDADLADLIRVDNPLAHYAAHGREPDALDPGPYFSSSWYLRVNTDVADAGMHPLAHYMHHGALEMRSTSPLFDAAYYKRAYPDVTGDALVHFTTIGLAEGRAGIAAGEHVPADGVRRFYRRFDQIEEKRFLGEIAQLAPDVGSEAAGLRVSVIMPAFNRAATIGAAIRSVLAQSHRRFELIVVDDGSTDGTPDLVRGFDDERVILVEADHGGVSAARNAGLDRATGDVVAYLDSDNRWLPWFLEVATRHMVSTGAEAVYAAIALRDEFGQLVGYRGAPFDWEACLANNYVDLNTFCHRRSTLAETGGFDTALRRMVDWDFILRTGKKRQIGYMPFVGCEYQDGKADRARVTLAEPAAFQKLVALKNRCALAVGSRGFMGALRLSFAIKCAAPEADRAVWGDYHFAEALAEAIRRRGHDARVDTRGHWGGHALEDEDVAIVLRGLVRFDPRPGQIGLLWCISHPDQCGYDEMERFDRVFTASPSHAAMLRTIVPRTVDTLPQATDPQRFRPDAPDPQAPAILFCGNSRGEDRPILDWAITAGLTPAIYGGGWEGRVPPEAIVAPSIHNARLAPLYAGAGVVLNDHWPSMRAFGIVSNRLFDVAAAGGSAISDAVEGIEGLFGDTVAQVDGPAALREAAAAILRDPPSPAERERTARAIAEHHSFDARAAVLVDAALERLGLPVAPPVVRAPAGDRPIRVHAIVPHAWHGPQSSTYIRLVAPLTAPGIAERVTLSLGAEGDRLPECDVCVVQRTALTSVDAVNALIRTLAATGARLVTDLDDAFRLIDEDHPEAETYRPLNRALDRVLAASAETWVSTPALARLYRQVVAQPVVMANALDPRLWRDWRAAPRPILQGGPVRMLYMGTHTHAADFAHIRPALDALAAERPGAFEVVLIGVAPDVPPAPWLSRLAPEADAISYPRFVRWLREQGPFDLGLAPLAPTAFNAGKSDIKLLDYAALGLLPVVEDCPAYRADPEWDGIAVHAADWLETLRAVLDDREAARARAAAAQERLWRDRAAASRGAALLERLRALTGPGKEADA